MAVEVFPYKKDELKRLKICVDPSEITSAGLESHIADSFNRHSDDGRDEDDETHQLKTLWTSQSVASEAPVAADHVQIAVSIKTKPGSSWTNFGQRRYENQFGNFITGIDITSEELEEQRRRRAERFGLNPDESKPVDIQELYTSLGITADDLLDACADNPEDADDPSDNLRSEEPLNNSSKKGIRLEAIHLRGVDEMSTQDVFEYFQEFAAGRVEWINDASCNVVWQDPVTAARAMIILSTAPASRSPEAQVSMDTSDDDDDRNEEEEEGNESMDVDPKRRPRQKKKLGRLSPISFGADEEQEESLPPGVWRIGVPNKKAKRLLMRFATRADRKQRGAERNSQYYRKYGNPNYNNLRGLITDSMRKRMQRRRIARQAQEARDAVAEAKRKSTLSSLQDELESLQQLSNVVDENERQFDARELITSRLRADPDPFLDQELADVSAMVREVRAPARPRMKMYADAGRTEAPVSSRLGHRSATSTYSDLVPAGTAASGGGVAVGRRSVHSRLGFRPY